MDFCNRKNGKDSSGRISQMHFASHNDEADGGDDEMYNNDLP